MSSNDIVGLYGSIDSSDELQAVNDILEVIGQAPVSSLRNQSDLDVSTARRMLSGENRKIQSKGWGFNIEKNVELLPDVYSGVISYNPSYLSVLDPSAATIYINRNGTVYDTVAQTNRFDAAIYVNLIVARPLSEMPHCFKEWIICSAAKRFNNSRFGDVDVANDLRERITEARIDCADYESDFGRYNMIEGNEFLDGMMRR